MKDLDQELFEAVDGNDINRVTDLLTKGANPNAKNTNDDYALYIALYQGKEREISLKLIEAMEPSSIQEHDSHALRITEDIEIIDKLLAKGADINQSDAMSWVNDPKVLQHLINKGGDVNDDLTNKKAPFLSSVRCGDLAKVKVFVENGAKISEAGAVDWALSSGRRDVADYLLEQTKGQVNNLNDCAYFSAGDGHTDLLERFHKQGADINFDNNKILEGAAERNHFGIARYVLENTDVTHAQQEEFLKGAIKHPEIVRIFLIEQKLQPSDQTKEWLKDNASKDVQDVLAKVELYEKLQANKQTKPTNKSSSSLSQGPKRKI